MRRTVHYCCCVFIACEGTQPRAGGPIQDGGREQMAYRAYLVVQLLPPMAQVFVGEIDMDADDGVSLLTRRKIVLSLQACCTEFLEDKLEAFYGGLLDVRTAAALRTSV